MFDHVTFDWVFGAGDLSVKGWMITVGYFIAAYFCQRAYVYVPDRTAPGVSLRDSSGQSSFWLFCFFLMIALGFNKQFDLQTLMTDLLRYHAKEYGWHGNRRFWQKVFILGITVVSLIGLAFIVKVVRKTAPGIKLAMCGLVCLCGFILSRAASFHHFDLALSYQLYGITLLTFVEPVGICIIIIAATQYIKSHGDQ